MKKVGCIHGNAYNLASTQVSMKDLEIISSRCMCIHSKKTSCAHQKACRDGSQFWVVIYLHTLNVSQPTNKPLWKLLEVCVL